MKQTEEEEKEMIRVMVENGKQKLKIKLSSDTKALLFEEFLKRDIRITPTETLYLFKKENRQLMTPSKALGYYAHIPKL